MSDRSVESRVLDFHRRGVEAINRGRPGVGARSLRSGLRLLDWPAESESPGWRSAPELTTRLLGALAAAEVAQGNTARGFELLDRADVLLRGNNHGNHGILSHHRGLLLVMVGRMDEALVHLDHAVTALRRWDERVALTRTLLNRALLHQTAGRVRLAMADLDGAESLARELNLPLQQTKAIHGRGACELLAGDIPAALRSFDAAGRGYADADGMLAVLSVEKSRALLAAGLHSEARLELAGALERFPRVRMDQEHAEAELTEAQIALALGELGPARDAALRAERRFRRRDNLTWGLVASLTVLRAEFAAGRRVASVAARATELAGQLGSLELDNDAEQARVLAARAHIARGELDVAEEFLARPATRRATLETQLRRQLARAELGVARGDRRATFASARTGLAILRDHRSTVGSVDLQTSTAALGGELARIGLAAALEDGSPPVIFRWLERSRAQAFRFPPVRPTADAETTAAVAELRQLGHQVRSGELAGRREAATRRRCAELERQIRAKGWQAGGTGGYRAEAGYAEVRAGLADAGSALVSYLSDRDRLYALVIAGTRASLHRLGELPSVSESAARLHSDLDALCGRRLPSALERVVRDSLDRQLAELTEALIAPLRPLLADLDVVLVPTGALAAVPWGLLPDLRGRPVTVTPSASAWLAGRSTRSRATGNRLLVAGPNLDHAVAELAELTKIYPDGTVLHGDRASVAGTLLAIRGCDTVHFAAHGHHERENVLFSRLDLADGPLMAYDIQQLGAAPAHVVLSSCDVGQAVVRTGDEILGFTAALLYSGSRTVISSVARVDDLAAVGVMAAYHRAITRGLPPARALADAALTEPLMPLVCFGSG